MQSNQKVKSLSLFFPFILLYVWFPYLLLLNNNSIKFLLAKQMIELSFSLFYVLKSRYSCTFCARDRPTMILLSRSHHAWGLKNVLLYEINVPFIMHSTLLTRDIDNQPHEEITLRVDLWRPPCSINALGRGVIFNVGDDAIVCREGVLYYV